MWQVEEVEAENFLGYEKLFIKFSDKHGITLFLGNRGPGRSNGAGKSTVFHAITYGLHGRLAKRLESLEKVIRRGSDSMKLRIVVSDAAGKVTITRKRTRIKGAVVETEGFDARALAGGQQEAIDARFGDFALFTATSMFAGDVSSFCKLPDANRKELLERMSNVGHYAGASEAAKEDATTHGATLQQCAHDLDMWNSRLEDLFGERAKHAYESFTHALRFNRAYRDMVEEALEMAETVDEAFNKLAAWITTAQANRRVAEGVQRTNDLKVMSLEEERDALDKTIEKLSEADGASRTRIQVAQDEIARLKSDRHPDLCSTCGQRWPQDGDPDKIAQLVAKHDLTILNLRREREPVTSRLREEKEKRDEIVTALSDLRRASKAVAVDDREYRHLLAEAIALDAELAQKHKEIADYAAEEAEEPSSEEIERIDAEVVKVHEKIAEVQEREAAAGTALDHAEFWKKGFGRSGLPSFLIDSSIPAMNEIANEIANDLTDGELTIRFNAASEKGSKSVFAVEVDYAEGGEGSDSTSNGEGTRVDMCVLFAIRDLAAKRSGIECSQLFLDEIFDGTDEHFVQSFMSMLRHRYKDRDVFVISHEPAANSLCDRTITASKRRAISVLA